MEKPREQLKPEERATIMLMRRDGCGVRAITRTLRRAQARFRTFPSECSMLSTDGWSGYSNLAALGYNHESVVLDGDTEKAEQALPMIHLVFSNLKAWLLETHHGVSQQHLPAYLNKFVFRFNRRFYPMTAFATALGIGMNVAGPTYRGLYDGQWDHRTRSSTANPL